MQKYGYEFTGERSSCYSSDLIMRQYNRVKSDKKKHFSFKDMKPVYQIVILEHSTPAFKKVSPHYIHRSQYRFDTGLEINLLSNFIFIALDTFHAVRQNIDTDLDAWLVFLSSDKPEDILELVEKYPEFIPYYHDIRLFRKNPRELMTMFSEALLIMDHNTANYMIEQQAKEIKEQAEEIKKQAEQLSRKEHQLTEKDNQLSKKDAEIARLKALLAAQQNDE